VAAQGTSSGQTGGGFANNQELHGAATGSLLQLLNNSGMDERTIQGLVSRGADELSESEKQARLEMRASAAAAGGGEGGDYDSAVRELSSNFAGQRAGQSRDIRLAAEQDRLNRQLGTLGTAFNFLGSVEDRAAADARWQQQMLRDDRSALMALMASNRPAVPNYSALAGQAGNWNQFAMPFGGGANQGAGPGSATSGGGANTRPTNTPASQGFATMAPAPQAPAAGAQPAAPSGYTNMGGSFSPSQGGAYRPPAQSSAAAGGAAAGASYASANTGSAVANNTDPHNPYYRNRQSRGRGIAAATGYGGKAY
jgi:hypothetical protein